MKNLFIFAHQDDEFGVFHKIKNLLDRQEEVLIIYLTSGTPDGSISLVRNAESLAALSSIGVNKQNVIFLGGQHSIPDGKLVYCIENAFHLLCNVLAYTGAPSKIYGLAWEGGHQDHDAAHLISLAIAKKWGVLENCYQIPLYTGLNTRWIIFRLFIANKLNGEPILTNIPVSERIQFLKYIFIYKSQIKTWIALFPFLLLHYIFYGTQVLQRVTLSRSLQKPHLGTMLYERRGFFTYNEFQSAAGSFIKKYL